MVILLYGTSTSGKTTISQNLKKLISNLKIDSTDSAFKRLGDSNNFEKILNYISKHKNEFTYLSQVQNRFTDLEICNAILDEKLNIQNKEVPLFFDLDEQTFTKQLENILDERYLIDKQAITELRNIAKSYLDQLFVTVHEDMFSLAVTHGIQGIPSILDIIPHPAYPGQFMTALFLNQLKKIKYSGPTHIALVHCSIPQLSERMLVRNKEALIHADLDNIRDKAFPFRQYSKLFEACDKNTTHISSLKIREAQKAIAPFCMDSLEIEKIIEELGFNNESNEIYIHAKCDFNNIYDSGSLTSSAIAFQIFQTLCNKGWAFK